MSYSPEIFEKAEKIQNERRLKAENEAEKRRRRFAEDEPEYRRWKAEMISSVSSLVKTVGMEPERASEVIEEQKEKNLFAQQKIAELLLRHSLPSDWLEPHYLCPKCSDTGVNGNRLCSCRIDIIRQLAFEEAGKSSPLRFSSFDDFSLDYYPDEFDKAIDDSPRNRMEAIFTLCKEYAADFDLASPNLLMCGKTGLGKTHLSLAIAGEAIKKGYNVLYNSAQNIFNTIQREHFSRSGDTGQYESLVLESDLLVIDDLGAEFATQFTNSILYNIINTRINLQLPTIISTNLTLAEIEDRYSDRISSRFIGEYTALGFAGKDVRQLKE